MTLTIAAIRENISVQFNAQFNIDSHNTSLQERLIHAYSVATLRELNNIINGDGARLVSDLKKFLADNWVLINNTALCYTAIPNSPITSLLCDIAEFVAEKQNKIKKANEQPVGIIQLLMPTVAVDSLFLNKYPNLSPSTKSLQDVDIRNILKTHIIGENGQYLIPALCINDYDDAVGFKPIDNPYYDFDRHSEDMAHLSKEDVQRLIEHSELTKQVFAAKDTLEVHANDKNNLLGHLRFLCSQLWYTSTEGTGSESLAGGTGPLAIFNFISYYDRLDPAERKQVPKNIQVEIQALRAFSSDRVQRASIDSCHGTRRREMEKAMRGHEALLSGIGLKGDTKESAIRAAKEQLQEARDNLSRQVSTSKYSGLDNLSVPIRLIDYFQILIKFQSVEDLDFLTSLKADEIRDLCTDSDMKRDIIDVINDIESFQDFIVLSAVRLTATQLAALLESLDPEFEQRYLITAAHFLALTLPLSEERRAIYYQRYKEKLPSLIVNIDDMQDVFSVLMPEQQSVLYEKIKPRLFMILSSLNSLFDLPAALRPFGLEVRSEMFKVFKENQLTASQDTSLSNGLLNFLPPTLLKRLYENIEEAVRLNKIDFSNGKDFFVIFAKEYAKAALSAAFSCSPLKSKSAFFMSVALPFAVPSFALWAGVTVIEHVVAGIADVLFKDANHSMMFFRKAAFAALMAITLALITAPVIALSITSLLLRSAGTVRHYLVSEADSDVTTDNDTQVVACY